MIRLEKAKQVSRITDANERTKLINEIKCSGPALKIVDQIIKERIDYLEGSLDQLLEQPYNLAASVKTISELRKLTQLFKETHNNDTD